MKNILIVLVCLFIIIGSFVYFKKEGFNYKISNPGNNIACTEEAKMCPDGSYVGRTGPNCEFSICPLPVVNNPDEVRGGGEIYACTMDAKICPDGSYVGRTGPKCEFAQCPAPKMPVVDGAPTHELNVTHIYDGISITPLKIVEDSRCPSDVQCIWAGRLVVKTRLEATVGASSGSGIPGPAAKKYLEEVDLQIGVPHKFVGKTVTLLNGVPYPKQSLPGDNREPAFSFEVK